MKLLSWRGSVLRKIASKLVVFFLINLSYLIFAPVTGINRIHIHESPFSFIGIAIAIFLGFRNNASWNRYCEGRILWGDLLITCRSLTRELCNTTSASVRDKMKAMHMILAFCYSLNATLRHKPVFSSIYEHSPQLGYIAGVNTPCNLILKEIGQWLFTFKKSELNYQNLNVYVDRMARIQGGCERISNTPIPFAYSLGLHRTIYIFCTLYPLLLIDTLGYLSLLFSVFTTYTLLSLDTIAEELEDPFGYEDNDLPLDAICNTIDIDLRQMMGDHHHPTKSTPDRKYRLS